MALPVLHTLIQLLDNTGVDHSVISSTEFEKYIFEKLKTVGEVHRQVFIEDRGDGRTGRIDFVLTYNGIEYAVEVDRNSPRKKSIFKVSHYNRNYGFVITKAPFTISYIPPWNQ